MQDEKKTSLFEKIFGKTSFFQKIFGQKSSCCSLEIEEVDSNEGHIPVEKNNVTESSCLPTNSDAKKRYTEKE